MRRYRLVFTKVLHRTIHGRDFAALAGRIERRTSDIEVVVAGRHRADQLRLLVHAFRPTLTIAFGAMTRRRFLNGRILHCPWIPKHEELERLRALGYL